MSGALAGPPSEPEPALSDPGSPKDSSISTATTPNSDATTAPSSPPQDSLATGRSASPTPESTRPKPPETADQLANTGEISLEEVVKLEEVADPAPLDSTVLDDEDGSWAGDADIGDVADVFDPDLKRVKVYELVASRWTDRGTAFCQGDFDAETNEAKLVARAESDITNVILSCTIRGNDVYQKQQDTLIVWTEPDGTDWALSFQEAEGCSEVWDFIVEVQRHLNGSGEFLTDESAASSSPQIGPQPATPLSNIIRSGQLPAPALGIMADIEQAIKLLSRTPTSKERLCELIRQQDYLRSMIDVMQQAEDLESTENLHALCSCMTTILLLNDHSMYEYILDDSIFLGVIGILEYDPEFPTHKANYRDFFTSISQYKQPIPFSDVSIQTKIHQTYRLQYLKDVILGRTLDDSGFNVLNSCIIFNQIDIINHVQSDDRFLTMVVSLFVDEDTLAGGGVHNRKTKPAGADEAMVTDETPDSTESVAGAPDPTADLSDDGVQLRRDVVFLIHQLCSMGKNVQLPARVAVFRTLVDRGVLFAVQWGLAQPEPQIVHVAAEVLAVMLDHDTGGVRGHVLKQVQAFEKDREAGKKNVDGKMTLMQLLCRMMAGSNDLAVQNQLGDALRVLMEVPQGEADNPIVGLKMLSRPKDDPSTERFLEYTYKTCIETLMKPLVDVPEFKSLSGTTLPLVREKANLYLYLCDLLCNFLLQHSFRSHFFVLTSNLAPRIASLLLARDKHLRLAALRFFRICIKLNNRNMHNHLTKHEVIGPILNLAVQESRRDNLLNASCQEFFEYMRKENPKDLIAHCMGRHEAKIRSLADTTVAGPRFKAFIRRWEINTEPAPKEEEKKPESSNGNTRRWRGGLEAEEEDWFNQEDEDEPAPAISGPLSRGTPPKGNVLSHRRRGRSSPALTLPPRRQLRPTRSPSPTIRLVDYVDDEDDASEPNESAPTVSPGESLSNASPVSDPVDKPSFPISSPTPRTDLLSPEPPRLEKRRRVDEDDDELLERLISKAKRPNVKAETANGVAKTVTPSKPQDDGPKKIKLKLGGISAVGTPPIRASPPPDPGTKDADTG